MSMSDRRKQRLEESRAERHWLRRQQLGGLTQAEFDQLAVYNTECSRGLMHTPAWDAQMAALQRRFDAAMRLTTL